MGLLLIAMANMVRSYCTLFPRSKAVLLQDEESAKIVDQWIAIGSTSTEDIEMDWESTDV